MKKLRTLLGAWEQTVQRAPGATALIDGGSGKIWTRGELDAFATAWCATRGAKVAGQTVVFAERNGAGWLTIFLGLLKAGAVAVALDPGEPPAAQRFLANAIGASFLWTAEGLEQLAPPRRAPRDGRRLIKLTSGTTGTPRALAFTDAQMLADGRQVCASMEISADDVNFALIPFGHSYGLGNLVVPLLAQGTAIIAGTSPLPHALVAEVARYRPTVFPAVPALLRGLAESDIDRAQLRILRRIISAGAPLAPEIARQFFERFGLKIRSFYGSSETGGISYDRTGDATLLGGVGTPLRGVRVQVGRGGRLKVSSAAVVTIGNRLRSDSQGMYRLADRAVKNSRGEITLTGRARSLVKIAGRRLNLSEVECVLRELPGVRDAFVALSTERTESLAAAVASDGTAGELRAKLRERLAAWKIPKKLLVLPDFPRTVRGKADTRRLLELLGARLPC